MKETTKTISMNRKSLLFTIALSFGMSAQAQMSDVTSQYISNAGFEECEALPTEVYHDNQKNVDIDKVVLYQESSVAKGYDYADKGWQLVQQETATNGGVITYGCNVQTGKWATAGEPGPASGITGTKGLCFVGNKGLIYRQTNEITLPAGIYRFTVNLYARNGQTTNPGPTQQVVNIKTGFMPTGGTEESLIPAIRKSVQFKSNEWDQEVIDIELTEATTGRFQISYGTSYYVVVDDVKLEYQGGVITTSLQTVVDKAQTLNGMLNDANLSNAIQTAQAFIENPTTQDDVATQVETLYNAMSAALSATALPCVNLTSVYVDNWSFETGKSEPWTWGTTAGSVGEPVNEEMAAYIDGTKIVTFAQNGSNSITQTISHLPAGFYLIDAKLNKNAELMVGATSTKVVGGTDPIMIHAYPTFYQATTAGDIVIGAKSNTAFQVDAFRLFYAKDEASLIAAVLPAVQADATAILNKSQYANITGEERSELQTAIGGTDGQAIVTAVNAFVAAKDAYDKFVKAKADAASYTAENYPYAKAETLQQIQTLINTEVTSRSIATENTTALTNACTSAKWENAYCEGKENTDYTGQIVAADATGSTVDAAWTVNNINILTITKTKARPQRDGTIDRVVYGTPDAYNSGTASIQQTLSNLPAGKYVVAVSMMAAANLPVAIRVNNQKVGTFTGTGHYASNGWNEVVCNFELTDASNVTLRLDEAADSGTKMWYADNFRLYRLTEGLDGIQSLNTANPLQNNTIFDLQGRRVSNPVRGMYIVNGKKVFVGDKR